MIILIVNQFSGDQRVGWCMPPVKASLWGEIVSIPMTRSIPEDGVFEWRGSSTAAAPPGSKVTSVDLLRK